MREPFDLDIWVKDQTRKVVDEDGRPVEIFKIQLPVHLWPFVPKDVDPRTCYTWHCRKEGSRNTPVLCGGPSKTMFFAD